MDAAPSPAASVPPSAPSATAWKRWTLFRGRTPLAWRNVTHHKAAMVISASAVSFAVLIMFMELGFLNGLFDSQTGLVRHLRGEIVVLGSTQHTLVAHETFPRVRLEQARAIPGIAGAYPLYIDDGISVLRNPDSGVENGVRLIGFNLSDPIFRHTEIEAQIDRLRLPRTILFDTTSRRFLGRVREGMAVELAKKRVAVTGTFKLGADYYYDGNVIASEETFFALEPGRNATRVSLGVLQLKPKADLATVLAALRRSITGDVEFLSMDEVIAREEDVWRKATPSGFVFMLGVVVGFVIGVIITYQILYTDISDHLPQLATMKALGYHNRDILNLVLKQGLLIGFLGFLPAVAMTFALYLGLSAITGVQTLLTLPRVGLVLGLTALMCLASGILASRRALAADPADLF